MGLDPDIQMIILIYFLYFVLPVLVGASAGVAFGLLFPQIGKLRGAALGLAVGTVGIVANVGYSFLVAALWECRYPSMVQISETRVIFSYYSSYRLRDTAYLAGPGLLAVAVGLVVGLVCRLWNQRVPNGTNS